jgi:hypothetical protein
MTKTNVFYKFAQRALWLYVAEAALVLGILFVVTSGQI